MGVRFPSVASTTFIGPIPANATETVILTTPPLTLSLDFSQVILLWSCSILAGTSTTSFVFRIRRGTTAAGTTIFQTSWPFTIAAGSTFSGGGSYVDTPGAVAGQQYSFTLVQTAATVAGTYNDGALIAFAL